MRRDQKIKIRGINFQHFHCSSERREHLYWARFTYQVYQKQITKCYHSLHVIKAGKIFNKYRNMDLEKMEEKKTKNSKA